MAHDVPRLRLLRGDEAQLFRDHEIALKCAVRHFAFVPETIVEDACSFAWLQLMRCQPDRQNVFAWLRTVAVHEAWRLSADQRRDRTLDALPAAREPQADTLDETIAAREALAAVAALPARQRRYVALIIAAYSYDEIAGATGTTHRTVNRHLYRARRHLRLVHGAD